MANNAYLTYCQRNKDLVLNKAKDYYKNSKDRLSKQAREKYNSLSAEEKDKKREYQRNKYHAMSEEEKNTKREYEKNRYHNMSKEKNIK